MKLKRFLAMMLTICMIVGILPVGALAVEAEEVTTMPVTSSNEVYPALTLDEEATATIDVGGAYNYFTFTPAVDMCGWFEGFASSDTYGYLYDANMNQLAYDDDGGNNNNFGISYPLEANTTYILGVRYYNSGNTGSFPVKVSHPANVMESEVTQVPDCTQEGIVRYFCQNCAYTMEERLPRAHNYVHGECTACGAEKALVMGERTAVTINVGGEYDYFRFTPTASCTYWFESHANVDTYGYLFDQDMNELKRDDDNGENSNFGLKYELEAGVTYILGCRFYNSGNTGSYEVSVSHWNSDDMEAQWEQEKTCTQDGIVHYTCQCGYSYMETISAGHVYEQTERVEPTCTEAGHITNVCADCGDIQTEVLEPTGHYFDNGRCRVCLEYQQQSGTVTETIGWSFNAQDDVLRIDGVGVIPDYSGYDTPWDEVRSQIKTIVVGEGITEIGNMAFYDHEMLKNVELPSTLTRIGNTVFSNCQKLEVLELPAGLTEIGASCFRGTDLRELTIPGGVETIEEYTFQECDKLVSVTLQEGVKTIDTQAFWLCKQLENVVLPSTLQYIYSDVFMECTALKTVDLPASMIDLYSNAFEGCTSLTAIKVDPANENYTSVDGLVYDFSNSLCIVPEGLMTATVVAGTSGLSPILGAKLQSLVFQGDAPINYQFSHYSDVTFYYPAGNNTWHENTMYDQGYDIPCLPLEGLIVLSSPRDMYVELGDSVTFSVNAVGADSYTWQYLNDDGEWEDVATGADWTFTATNEDHGKVFVCAVSDGNEVAYTENFMLYVYPVVEMADLSQEYYMTLDPRTHGTVTFTAEDTGMYILHHSDGFGNLKCDLGENSDCVWQQGAYQLYMFVQAGQEYTIRLNNTSPEYYDTAEVTLWMTKALELPVDQHLTVNVTDGEEVVLAFTPLESDWYHFSGYPTYSIADAELNYPVSGENNYWWMDAGVTHYIRLFDGSYQDHTDCIVAVYRRADLKVGDVVSGVSNHGRGGRYVYFTPETTGRYRFVTDDVNVSFSTNGSNMTNYYIELQAGVEYCIYVGINTDEYVEYSATLEQLPIVSDGYEGVIDHLDYGKEYIVGFVPEFSDKYIITACAADGTRMYMDVNYNSGSEDWILTAGEMVIIRINNQSGEPKDNITIKIRRQPALELEEDLEVDVTVSQNGYASFTPAESGLYCFTSPTSMYIGEPNWTNAIMDDWISDTEYKSYFYLQAGNTYYLSFHSEAEVGSTMSVRVDKVRSYQVGENIPVNTAPGEQFVTQVEISEAHRYYFTSLTRSAYDCEERLWKLLENGGWEYVSVIYTYDDEHRYATAELEPGMYMLRMDGYSDALNGSICLTVSPDPDSIRLEEQYVWQLGDYGGFDVEIQPAGYATLENVQWTMGTPGIIEITDVSGNYVEINTLSGGTTTLTATLPNGNTYTTTIVVKAPIQMNEGDSVEVTVEPYDFVTLKFTPEESGYYVVWVSNSQDVSFTGNWQANKHDALETYFYHYWYEGSTYTFQLRSYNKACTTTVEMRKAETPTALTLPEEKLMFVDESADIEVEFGSLWEYDRIEWTQSVDLLYTYNSTGLVGSRVDAHTEGTTVLTATCGELSDSCNITVVDALSVTEEAPLSVTIPGNATYRAKFVPLTDGWYTLNYGGNVDADLYGSYASTLWSQDSVTTWMTAGSEYTLYLRNYSGGERDVTVSVGTPAMLNLDETQNVTMPANDNQFYLVKPEVTGYYYLHSVSARHMDISIRSSDGQHMGLHSTDAGNNNYYRVMELEAGKTYLVAVNNYYAADQDVQLTFKTCPAPTDIYLGTNSRYIAPGDEVGVYVSCEPAYAFADVQISLDDSGVLEWIDSGSYQYYFRAVKAGEATITATYGNIVETVTVYVKAPVTINTGDTLELNIADGDYEYVVFTPDETGYYVYRVGTDQVDLSANWEYIRYVNGEVYIYQYCYAGEPRYLRMIAADEQVSTELELRAAVAPTVLNLPETMTMYVDENSTINLSFGSDWEYAGVEWNISNGLLSVDFRHSFGMGVRPQYEGTCTVSVTCGNLSASCAVEAKNAIPMTLGEPLEVELGAYQTARLGFDPDVSGYYSFYFGDGVRISVYSEYGGMMYGTEGSSCNTYRLDSYMEYYVYVEDVTGTAHTTTVTVNTPDSIALDETVSFTLPSDDYRFYQFTVPADGNYALRVHSPRYSDVSVMDEYGNHIASGSESDEYNNYYTTFAAEAGKLYTIRLRNNQNIDQSVDMTLMPAVEPTDISVGREGMTPAPGDDTWLYVHYEPVYAMADFEVTLDDAGVMEIVSVYGNQIRLHALKAGTTVATVTCNGIVKTISLTVKEPTILNVGAAETVTIPGGDMVSFKPQIAQSGYYVVRINDENPSLNGNFPYYIQRIDGEAYLYMYCYEGSNYQFAIRNNRGDEAKSVTVELRKAETPTALSLPTELTMVRDYFARLTVNFGSAWEMGEVEWSFSNNVLYVDYENNGEVSFGANSLGTCVVTATCGNMSASCTVTVVDNLILTEDEPLSVNVFAWGEIPLHFTPEESGWYLLRMDEVFDTQVNSANGAYVDRYRTAEGVAAWMAGGQTYALHVYNNSDVAQKLTVTVDDLTELAIDDTQTVVASDEFSAVYQFTPTETGHYSIHYVAQNYVAVDVCDWEGEYHQTRTFRDGPNYYTTVKIEAGQTYMIALVNHSEGEQNLEFTLTTAAEPSDMQLVYNRKVLLQDSYGSFDVQFQPFNAAADVDISVEPADVLEIVYNDGYEYVFMAKKPGQATVTVTCGDIVRTLKYHVVEPQGSTVGAVEQLTLEPFSGAALNYQISEAGYYVLRINGGADWGELGEYCGMRVEDGQRYIYLYIWEEQQTLLLSSYWEEEMTLEVELRKAETPTAISIKETESVYVGNTQVLEATFASPWEFGPIEWSSSNEEILSINAEIPVQIDLYGRGVGSAVVTASSGKLKDTCAVTVSSPTIKGQLQLGQYAEHMMTYSGDYGYYSFTAPAAGDYFFAVLSINDARMYIYNTDWRVIAENDDYQGLHSGKWLSLTEGQTVYICARTHGGRDIAFLKTVVATNENVYDVSLSKELKVNEPVDWTLASESWFSFTPEATGQYTFYIQGESNFGLYVEQVEQGAEFNSDTPVTVELEAGVTYNIWLAAYDGGVHQVTLSVESSNTPWITAMENTATGVKLTWDAIEGAGKYRVYIMTESGWKKLADTTSTSLVHTAAESGHTYQYTVRAMNAAGTAFVSDYNKTGWFHAYVAQPAISKLESTAEGVKVTWNAVAGAEQYRVFVKTSKGWTALADIDGTSYVYKSAVSGETYAFTIRCVSAEGEFVSSYNKTGWKHTYVAQPAISKLENTATGIKITWNKVAGAGKYRVFVKTSKGWTKLADTTANTYTYTAAKSGQTYSFTVRALNTAGTAFVSSYNTAGWKQTYVAQPGITGFENTASGIKLTWDKVTGAGKYRVYVKTSKGWTKLADTTANTYTYTAAKSGQTYSFTVRAMNAAGTAFVSSYNATGWSHTFASAPTAPEVTSIESVPGGIKLTWDAINGAEKYRVFIKSIYGWSKLVDTTDTSYVYPDARLGSEYSFTVRCINAAGTAYTSSYNATGWTHTFAPVPEITKQESATGGIKLTWSAINGAGKYRVFVKTSKGWTKLTDTVSTYYTYTDAKLGSTYTFTVRCMNATGSVYTSAYNTTGWKHTFKPVPAMTKFESTTNGLKVTWGAINGAAKYRVFVKTSKGWTKLADVTGTSYTYTGAQVGLTYTFTVRCLSADGKTYTSAYNTTGWKYNFSPTPVVTLKDTTKGIQLTWTELNGAAKYRVFVKTSKGWTKLADVTGGSYLYTAAKSGTTYTFTVRAINAAGNAYTSSYNTTGWSIKHG